MNSSWLDGRHPDEPRREQPEQHELPGERLRAEELETLLAARAARRPAPSPTTLPPADAGFAAALLDLARATQPDAAFASALEERLRASMPAVADPEPNRSGKPRAAGAAGGEPRPLLRDPHAVLRWRVGRQPLRRTSVVAAAAALLLAALLLVPPVQASVQALLRIGGVRIFATTPTALPGVSTSPTPVPLTSVLDLSGETTLDHARQQAGFPVRLPTYPPDLGPPQHVFLQDLDGAAVVLVWTDPNHPNKVRMSLHELSQGVFAYKFAPPIIQETTVHGQRALWTDGPYLVQVGQGDQTQVTTRRLVTGHVLIWTEGAITYRLETSLPLSEAVRVAESLR